MRHRVLEIGAYGVAAAAQSGTAFVMLPLLTRMLAPGGFGQWVLLDPVLVYGAQLALVGANYGLIKLIGKDGLDLRYVCRRVIPPASAVILFAAITGGLLTGWLATDPLRGMGVALAIAAEGLFILSVTTRGKETGKGSSSVSSRQTDISVCDNLWCADPGGWFTIESLRWTPTVGQLGTEDKLRTESRFLRILFQVNLIDDCLVSQVIFQ